MGNFGLIVIIIICVKYKACKKLHLICRRQEEDESSLEGMQDNIEKIIEDATSLDGDGFENLDMVTLSLP